MSLIVAARTLRCLALAGLLVAGPAAAPAWALQNVTLAWQPSAGPNVAGYCVYYGTVSGTYDAKVIVTNGTVGQVTGLWEGVTYYFTVTAFGLDGLESAPSNEVAYAVPGVWLTLQKIQYGGFPQSYRVTSAGVMPARWALEASEDLEHWKKLRAGTNAPVDTIVVTYGTTRLFFRVRGD